MKRYYFATGNKDKFVEVSRIMKKLNPNVIIEHLDLSTYEIDEIQGTPEKISLDKTKKVVENLQSLTKDQDFDGLFTEDISLHCLGLYGMPGPYIKECEKNIGLENFCNLVINTGNTVAKTTACYTIFFKKIMSNCTVSKHVYGNIVNQRGNQGFGFDEIFQPLGQSMTFAEMNSDTKDSCSHRTAALNELLSMIIKVESVNEKITNQGNLVRKLKTQKAEAEDIKKAVDELISLKTQLAELITQ